MPTSAQEKELKDYYLSSIVINNISRYYIMHLTTL